MYKYLGRQTRSFEPASVKSYRKYHLGTLYFEGKDGTRTAPEFYTSGNGSIAFSNAHGFYLSELLDDDKDDGGQSLLLLLNEIDSNLKKAD